MALSEAYKSLVIVQINRDTEWNIWKWTNELKESSIHKQQMSLRLHWIQTIHIAQANYRNYTIARKQLKQTENRRRTKRMFTRWYFAIGKKTCRICWTFLFVRLLIRFSMAQHCKKKEGNNAKKAGKMYLKNVYMCGSARLRVCIFMRLRLRFK